MKQTNKDIINLRIRDLRLKHHLTQAEFAKRLSVEKMAISKWECGYSMPRLPMVRVICNTFSVSADWLLGITQEDEDVINQKGRKEL